MRGLRPQIGDLVSGGTEVRLQHQVELAGFGEKRPVVGVVLGGSNNPFARFTKENQVFQDFLGGIGLGRSRLADIRTGQRRHRSGWLQSAGGKLRIVFPRGFSDLRFVKPRQHQNRVWPVSLPRCLWQARALEVKYRAVLGRDLIGPQAGFG